MCSARSDVSFPLLSSSFAFFLSSSVFFFSFLFFCLVLFSCPLFRRRTVEILSPWVDCRLWKSYRPWIMSRVILCKWRYTSNKDQIQLSLLYLYYYYVYIILCILTVLVLLLCYIVLTILILLQCTYILYCPYYTCTMYIVHLCTTTKV